MDVSMITISCNVIIVFIRGKLLQPEAIFRLQMHEKRLATGLCPGPHGELTLLPRPRSWILGGRLAAGNGGQGRDKGWG